MRSLNDTRRYVVETFLSHIPEPAPHDEREATTRMVNLFTEEAVNRLAGAARAGVTGEELLDLYRAAAEASPEAVKVMAVVEAGRVNGMTDDERHALFMLMTAA